MAEKKDEKQTGQVAKGTDDPGNRGSDGATAAPRKAQPAAINTFTADLTDSPAGQQGEQKKVYRYRDGRERNPTPAEIQAEKNAAFAQRRAAEKQEALDRAKAQREGAGERGMAMFRQRQAEIEGRRAARDAQYGGGNFDGMTKISAAAWDRMNKADEEVVQNYRKDANGNDVLKVDANGNPLKDKDGNYVRETEGAPSLKVTGPVAFDADKNKDGVAAINDWAKNQWKTNFNGGVAFSRYDGGFDASRLPKGLFKNGQLDVTQIKSQRQFDAVMHIMKQDQESVSSDFSKRNGGRTQNMGSLAERQLSAADTELRRGGINPNGMSRNERLASAGRLKVLAADKAVKDFREMQSLGGPTAQAKLDAQTALSSAGFTRAQVAAIFGGDDTALRQKVGDGKSPKETLSNAEPDLRSPDQMLADSTKGMKEEWQQATLPKGVPSMEQLTKEAQAQLAAQAPKAGGPSAGPTLSPQDANALMKKLGIAVRVPDKTETGQALAASIKKGIPFEQSAAADLFPKAEKRGAAAEYDKQLAGLRDQFAQAAKRTGPSVSAAEPKADTTATIRAAPAKGGMPMDPFSAALVQQGGIKTGVQIAAAANPASAAVYVAGGMVQAGRGYKTGSTEDMVAGGLKIAGGLTGLKAGMSPGAAATKNMPPASQFKGGAMPGSKTQSAARVRLEARAAEGEGVINPQALQGRPGTDVGGAMKKYDAQTARMAKAKETGLANARAKEAAKAEARDAKVVEKFKAESRKRAQAEKRDIAAARREGLKAQEAEYARQHKAYDKQMEQGVRRSKEMTERYKKDQARARVDRENNRKNVKAMKRAERRKGKDARMMREMGRSWDNSKEY